MGPQTTATTVGLFPLAAIPPQTSRDLLKERCKLQLYLILLKIDTLWA